MKLLPAFGSGLFAPPSFFHPSRGAATGDFQSAGNRVTPEGQGYTVTSWSDSLPPIWLSIALTASGTRVATRQEHPLRGLDFGDAPTVTFPGIRPIR